MPIKTGDRVRVTTSDYSVTGNQRYRMGDEFVVEDTMGCYNCVTLIVKGNKSWIFEKALELVTPEKEAVVEKKFEVGKKYKSVNTQIIYTCIAVSNKRGWLCFDDSYETLIDHKNCGSNFIEYTTPHKVVKKTGWVRVYADSTHVKQPSIIHDACSLVFDTEDHAKNSHVKSTRPFFVSKIEWDEVIEDKDDDTI